MAYVNEQTRYSVKKEDYHRSLEVLDNSGEGKEADVEDLTRVLKLYSGMSDEEVQEYLHINLHENTT